MNDFKNNDNQDFLSSNKNNDNAFIIGKGFNIDQSEDYNLEEEEEKMERKGLFKSVAFTISIIVFAIAFAFLVVFAGADYLGIGFGRGDKTVVEIPMGSPAVVVTEKLEECGAVKFPLFFRLYAKLKGYDSQFKYGVYTFNTEAGYESLANMLITQGAKAETVSVKIPEGATIDDIATLLNDAGVCTKTDFLNTMREGDFDYDFVKQIPKEKVYYRLEGYLYPDTYDFYCYDSKECAYLAIDKMLKNLDSKLTKKMRNDLENSDYSFHEIMSLSSVIQLEAGNFNNVSDKDRAKVASVFYNRLEGVNWKGPKYLQSDPTTHYPYGNGNYNTYKTEGLPVGPLCSPSIDCIKAAINPDRSCKAVYFVTDKQMKFYYNETLKGHNKTVADLKKAGNWVYSTLGS